MKRITPYEEINEALLSLDNGGRFYNILTKSNDGIIDQSELGKVGGLFNDKQKMILFLELSMTFLKNEERKIIIGKLDKDLKQTYLNFKSQILLPSEANEKGIIASNAILTGVPKLVDEKSDFTGFIFVPIMTGKVMTFIMIPIVDNYNVYELRDEKTSETFIIAHSRDSKILPNEKIIIAGVFKELKSGKNENSKILKFLEANYYISEKKPVANKSVKRK
ncbi:hypothetical protein [Gramella sp. AN32]|uniref:Uncharacterized protein n=1 Tax=Christiangramia antarctica TaxID=2058158 RepID=A0ABW5X5S9_9FLAO|nr:hypothetical protein [Gramella sp. AN32]MCM4158223.1 hypothetical protein [Gramella sp. AN32]